jgi:hypothetical protein
MRLSSICGLHGDDTKQLLQRVTSYVAEPLLRYYEDQEELLLYLNETAKNTTPSRKLKTMP